MASILVVDDEAPVCRSLKVLLESEGHTVAMVGNGRAAMDLLEKQAFDLMISDIRMTPMDGMELLKEAHRVHPHLTVLMMTGYGSLETATESLRYDVFDYVLKPFRIDEMLDAVGRALEHHKAVVAGASPEQLKTLERTRTRRLKAFLREKDISQTNDVPKTL